MKEVSGKLDHIGFTASLLCAIHCAVMPLVITILPIIGLEFLSSPWIEGGMIVLSIVIGLCSLVPSYMKYHRNIIAILLLFIGFVMVLGTRLGALDQLESIVVPIGGTLIALAHYVNWRLLKKRNHEHHC